MQQNVRTGYLLSACAALVWALTSPGIKYLLDVYHVPELVLAFWRDALIALVGLLGLLMLRPDLLRVRRRALRGFALIGAFSIGVYHALWVASIAINGAAVAIVLIYTFPTFVTLGAWLLFRESIRWPHLAALAMALIGCGLLVRVYDPAILRLNWPGAVIGLATGMTHAGYVLFNQRAMRSYSPWTSLTYTMLFGSLVLLVLALVAGTIVGTAPAQDVPVAVQRLPYVLRVGATPTPWLVLLALALGPTLGGYAIFTTALRYIPGRVASLITVLEAPVATLLAVLLLGERLELLQVAGILFILGAIGLPHFVTLAARQWQVATHEPQLAIEE